MKRIFIIATLVAAFVALLALTGAKGSNGRGEGHTPVTICHKPSTPAEQTLVVDDDSVELTGHLGHGDTIGPCEDTTEEPPGDTDEPPVDTPPVSPPTSTCAYTGAGKDGQVDAYGGQNDDCAPLPSTASEPLAPAICPIPEAKVVTVTKIVPKVKTKIVVKYRTKIKVIVKYKVKTVVKIKKVYVPGVYADGVAGKG